MSSTQLTVRRIDGLMYNYKNLKSGTYFWFLTTICVVVCTVNWETFYLASTGSCNDNQTVKVKMSSSYSIFKMSKARISSKYAVESVQSVLTCRSEFLDCDGLWLWGFSIFGGYWSKRHIHAVCFAGFSTEFDNENQFSGHEYQYFDIPYAIAYMQVLVNPILGDVWGCLKLF